MLSCKYMYIGELDAIPTDFSMSASDPTFSSRRISLIQGFVLFLGTVCHLIMLIM